ncbi:tRNA (adenosine(37)-N6)-threonylcarbamoyltransferase complex ATPase subunit type 1 TsaE [Spelaeicoccus albus]|uniref:tRNA threonylcarbamoyladenosine biosynthesis protein TsaE n=1 Tax=Spelaeicoccus albus TaxID=1280376 RepID=A0A7Z0D1B4_9MICO|nr:tRNA (adenosine(37)-N6)-threonylcarbamoyltransferase complex ATPase subunit type 1 TsaE [Spelaeicoccus albus]NYI65800.1 tRNA threonylcarbamoyladenosine biosynthesis protein TsaE [Spelaeicoccus albus]
MDESPTVTVAVPGTDAMHAFGRRLAGLLRAGDLLVLDGALGAGKTTLTQGIGTGLGVQGAIISPTFVIARVHRSLVGGPALVHVDAYRLSGADELDDLDLDADLDESVTVVEWGAGLAEMLSTDRLEIHIARPVGDASAPDDGAEPDDVDEPRTVTIRALGQRWSSTDFDAWSAIE